MPSIELPSSDGVRVVVEDLGGKHPNLLLVPGASFPAAVFAPLSRLLAPRRCLLLDLRGHGRSGRPASGDFAWRGFADDVGAALAFLDGPTVGVGHSLGASALLLAAALAPGPLEALYCYEPIVPIAGGELAAAADRLAAGARRRTATFADRAEARERFLAGPLGAFDPEALDAYLDAGLVGSDGGPLRLACAPEDEARIYEAAPSSGLEALLGGIEIPVTLAVGAESQGPVPVAVAQAARLLPRVERIEVGGLGHFGPLERPDLVAPSVIRAIETPPT